MVEIIGIRQRIYDTVVLGRGTNSSSAAAALEGEEELPVAARKDVNEVSSVLANVSFDGKEDL